MNKITKKIVAGAGVVGLMSGIAAFVPTANAGILDGDQDWTKLFVLDRLFTDDGLFGARTVTVRPGDTLSQIALDTLGDASRFDEIAALNNIANPNLIFPGQVLTLPAANEQNGILGGGTNLGDLIILDELFGNNGDVLGGDDSNLKDLIILDQLFGGTNGIFDGANGTDGTNLGDLFVLSELFGDNGDGVLGGGDNDLGDLIILDQLFGGTNGFLRGGSNLGDLIILDELFN